MNKEEFLSRQRAAELWIKNRNHFIPWLSFMVTISMFLAIPWLVGLFCWTIFKSEPAVGLLWEIAFCSLVAVLTHCERRYNRQSRCVP
jgi:hypothetical protein